MYVPLRDVTLDEEELAEIEELIELKSQEIYEGEMPSHNRSVMRAEMIRERKFWKWEAQDVIHGQDDGEVIGKRN